MDDRLSTREREVSRLIMEGYRVPLIAEMLFITESTVRNHLSSIFRKLRVNSQQEMILLLRPRLQAAVVARRPATRPRAKSRRTVR